MRRESVNVRVRVNVNVRVRVEAKASVRGVRMAWYNLLIMNEPYR